jgi:hypothetical protein
LAGPSRNPDPHRLPAAVPRALPCFSRDNRAKNSFAAGTAPEIEAKAVRFQRLEPQPRGVGKAANRGEKRPEQRGQKRQQGSNRVDKAVSEHTARSPFIGGHELQDTLRIWQLFRRREYAGHLGRPSPHERPRAARARPTPAPGCAPMSLKPLLIGGGVLAVHLGGRPPACRTAYRLRSGPYRDLAP